MKKILTSIIVIVLVLTCALALLTGCVREATDYEHTIVFYSNQGSALKNITAEVIAEFEAKYPGWKVDHDTSAGSWNGLPTLIIKDIRNGNQPDLAYCYPDHVATYLTNRTVVDLNKYFASEETFNVNTFDSDGNVANTIPTVLGYSDDDRDDFIDLFMADGRAGNFTDVTQYGYASNALLALPFIKSTEVLFYNQTALEKLVDILKNKSDPRISLFVDSNDEIIIPQTWDVLWAQCAVIKDYFTNVTPLTYDSEANWFITMCAQNGWKYTDKSADEHYPFRNQQGLEKWLGDLYKYYKDDELFLTRLTMDPSGNSYTSEEFAKGVGVIVDENSQSVKIDNGEGGGAVFCIGSSGGATYQDATSFSVGIAPIPGTKDGAGQANAAIAQGPSFVMFRGGHGVSNADEKEKMTWLFMKMMLEPRWQVKFCGNNGYIPSRESSYDVVVGKDLDDNEITFGDRLAARAGVIAYAEDVAHKMQLEGRFFTSPAFDGSSTARDCVEALMIKVLGGSGASNSSIKLAIQQAYDDCGGLH